MKLSLTTGASVAPTPEASQPVAASGQTVSSLTDATLTVEAGVYAITSEVGYVVLGWSSTDTAANILFVCPEGKTILIDVPIGTTVLHYKCV
jgi:hypothetical protein